MRKENDSASLHRWTGADSLKGSGNGRARGIERMDDERARTSEINYLHAYTYTYTHAYTGDEGEWENDERKTRTFYALVSYQRQTPKQKLAKASRSKKRFKKKEEKNLTQEEQDEGSRGETAYRANETSRNKYSINSAHYYTCHPDDIL